MWTSTTMLQRQVLVDGHVQFTVTSRTPIELKPVFHYRWDSPRGTELFFVFFQLVLPEGSLSEKKLAYTNQTMIPMIYLYVYVNDVNGLLNYFLLFIFSNRMSSLRSECIIIFRQSRD